MSNHYKRSPAPIETITSCYDLPSELRIKLPYNHIDLHGNAHNEKLIEFDPRTGNYTVIEAEWGEVKNRWILGHQREDGRYGRGPRPTA
jgi:hypothetical protein